MNMTIGHHGLFSITPVWALLPVGWILGLAVGRGSERWFHIAVLTASTVCFLFYLNRPLIDRNYGGQCLFPLATLVRPSVARHDRTRF